MSWFFLFVSLANEFAVDPDLEKVVGTQAGVDLSGGSDFEFAIEIVGAVDEIVVWLIWN